jgi:hypothetical protein
MLIFRSEYEDAGDRVYDLNFDGEGDGAVYSITDGNADGYYTVDPDSGVLSFSKVIPDIIDEVTEHDITVSVDYNGSVKEHKIKIVDGVDYMVHVLHPDMMLMKEAAERYQRGDWFGINNLWGQGEAVNWVDFRCCVLVDKKTFPDGTIVIWDLPPNSPIHPKGIWGYPSVYVGSSILEGYPFRLKDIEKIIHGLSFRILYGTSGGHQIAYNAFFMPHGVWQWLGDYFMAIDSGTYYPRWNIIQPDPSDFLGRDLTTRYSVEEDTLYVRRHSKIMNNQKFRKGEFDMMELFNYLIDYDDPTGLHEKCLSKYYDIENISLGVEVFTGFGAISFDRVSCEFKINEE